MSEVGNIRIPEREIGHFSLRLPGPKTPIKCPSCPPLVVPGAFDPALQPNRSPSPPCMLLPVLPGSQHHQIRGEVTTRVPIDMVDLFLAPQLSVVQVLPELAVEEHFIGFGAWQSEKKIAIPMLMVGDHLWHSHHASICFPLLCLKFGKIIRPTMSSPLAAVATRSASANCACTVVSICTLDRAKKLNVSNAGNELVDKCGWVGDRYPSRTPSRINAIFCALPLLPALGNHSKECNSSYSGCSGSAGSDVAAKQQVSSKNKTSSTCIFAKINAFFYERFVDLLQTFFIFSPFLMISMHLSFLFWPLGVSNLG